MEKGTVEPFRFKAFSVWQDRCKMKVGTDGVLLGAWVEVTGRKKILDIGSGTGVIAIMLAQRTEDALVHGVEIDASAFEQSKENMQASPWSDRLEVFHRPIQEHALVHGEKYDLIVSNPPFFSGGTFSANQDRNEVRHTIKLPHGELLGAVRDLLGQKGKFGLVLPYIEGLRFQELALEYGLFCTRITEVRPKNEKPVERLLMEYERYPETVRKAELVIQEEKDGDWTSDYIELTRAFYLKM